MEIIIYKGNEEYKYINYCREMYYLYNNFDLPQ